MSTKLDSESPLMAKNVLGDSYPVRGAATVLSKRVGKLLRHGGYQVGDRFLTDDELVEHTGLSRSTVRRALATLRDEGWLHRRAGLGTYVGKIQGGSHADRGAYGMTTSQIRIGLLAFSSPTHDWLTPQVMQGINDVADDHHVRVELLNGLNGPLSQSLDKLATISPDVVVSLSVNPKDAMLLEMAMERGMKCLVTGTAFPELDLPRVCEDNAAGMAMVVEKLAALGHKRIGLMMRRWVGKWLFQRHEQWQDSMREFGLEFDEQLMHWFSQADERVVAAESFEYVHEWVQRAKPTAIIGGHYLPALHLGHLIRDGRLCVPEQVSVAIIDRHPEVSRMLGMTPACAVLPLREMGRTVVKLADAWCKGESPPSLTKLPMMWEDGETLSAINQ